MSDSDFPAPESGFVVTHFLVVSDQDRSRDFYARVFGAKVALERDPVIMRLEPKDHAHEIRAYIRDPDGHLIEVGQSKSRPGLP